MDEPDDREKTQESKGEKPTSRQLRERLGGPPQAAVEEHGKRQARGRKVAQALQEGPRTVPEVARATGLPPHQVLWHIMSMKKYGKVVEGEEEDGYLRYGLKEKES